MPDRSIVTRLRVEASQFLATMGKASKAVEGVGKSADQSSKQAGSAFSRLAKSARENETHINRMGNSALVAGGAIAAGLGFGAKAFADFDAAMSGVNAALPEAGANLERLRQAAIDLGSDTQFSATEAAQGITELGKAGVEAGDILGGGLKGSLDLAAAGQLGVAEAAEIAATAMVQFKREGSEVPHIADLLAAGAGKAQGSVSDMGMALKQAGLVASSTGVSLEETVGTLSAFAAAGLVGSDAGTSLKTMLQRLTPQSEEAAAQFEALGVSAYDANGQFVGLSNFAGQLQTAMKDLTPEARNAALSVMFGADAVRGANVLYEQGATGIAKWTGAVNDAGFASEQAAKLTDNLKGDIERLGGALDAVFVQNGEGANGALRNLVQGVEGLVEGFGRLPQPAQQGALGIAAVTGATLLAFGALAKGVTAASDFAESMDVLRTKSPRAAKGIDITTKAMKGFAVAAAAMTAAGAFAGDDDVQSLGVQQLTGDLLAAGDAIEAIDQKFKSAAVLDNLTDSEVKSFGDALRYAFDPGVEAQVNDVFDSLGSAFGVEKRGDIAIATKRLGELDATLASMASSGDVDRVTQIMGEFTTAAAAQGVTADELKQKFPLVAETLAGLDNAQKGAQGSAKDVATKLGGVEKAAADAQESVADLADEIRGFGKTALDADEARDALEKGTIDFTNTVADNAKAVEDGEKAKREAYLDNKDALRGLADLALENSAATLEQTGSAEKAAAAMRTGREDFIKAAGQMGINAKEAEKLADKYELIPENVKTTVAVSGAEAARVSVQNLIDTIARLNSKTVNIRYAYSGTLPNGGRRTSGGIDAGTGGRDDVIRRADGGPVRGPGSSTSDSIPALLSDGEYVVRAAAVSQYGVDFLDKLNAMRFASGGLVASPATGRVGSQISWGRYAAGGMVGRDSGATTVTETTHAPIYVDKVVTPDVDGFRRRAQEDAAFRGYIKGAR